MRSLFSLLNLLACSFTCFPQSNTHQPLIITGRTMTVDSQAIMGTTVRVKSRHLTTSADRYGNYRLEGAQDGDSIVFTHVSYKRVTLKVKGNNIINVVMERNVLELTVFDVRDSIDNKKRPAMATQPGDGKNFDYIEIRPAFPGGTKKLHEYLAKVIRYPEEAKRKSIDGEVVIGFIVGIEGEIKNVKLVRGISKECDEVALKAVREMTRWQHAIQNGRPIESYIELPITFSLTEISSQ